MPVKRLRLNNFRNFESFEQELDANINVITGANGSGKTSLLESIYLLSTGKSFRTNNLAKVINFNFDDTIIYAELDYVMDGGGHSSANIGYSRKRNAEKNIRLNCQPVKLISDVTKIFPVACLDGNNFRAILESPLYRRKLFDWGVFHVKHYFLNRWSTFNTVLKQRNKLLRDKRGLSTLSSWDEAFVDAAYMLMKVRSEYLAELKPLFLEYLTLFNKQTYDINIELSQGVKVNNKDDLHQQLVNARPRDIERGFTTIGPQRSDLIMRCKGGLAKDILSRGQQKVTLVAFFLAQFRLLKEKAAKSCTILIDDLAAELDNENLDMLYTELSALDHQLVISAINSSYLPECIQGDNVISLD